MPRKCAVFSPGDMQWTSATHELGRMVEKSSRVRFSSPPSFRAMQAQGTLLTCKLAHLMVSVLRKANSAVSGAHAS